MKVSMSIPQCGALALASLATLAVWPRIGAAEVKLADPFADGAVLQRGMRVPVWGTAAPGERVEVSFAGQATNTVAGDDGKWRVDLSPMEAWRPLISSKISFFMLRSFLLSYRVCPS